MMVTAALATMLALLLVIAAVSLYTLTNMRKTIEEVVEETTEEGQPILNLLHSVQKSDHSGHDYLTYVTDYERFRYTEAAAKTIKAFESTLTAPFEDKEEKKLVRRAFIKWKVVHNLIISHSTDKDPVIKLQYMRKIDSQIEEIEQALVDALGRTQHEMNEMESGTSFLWRLTSILIIFISILALAIAIFLWNWLVSGITGPLEHLAKNIKAVGIDEHPIEAEGLSDDEMGRLVRAVNDMAGRVYSDANALKDMAEHDELTGLYNHRALMGLLEDEVVRSLRYNRFFSFILLDVDNFKEINDTYGHVAGDEAMKQLAVMIKESIREVDKVARYGGDEIAIILPETKGSKALAMADRIRLGVAAQYVLLPGGEMKPIEISVGLAEYPGGKDTVRDLIEAADGALYDAKRSGRNTVCMDSWLKNNLS